MMIHSDAPSDAFGANIGDQQNARSRDDTFAYRQFFNDQEQDSFNRMDVFCHDYTF